MDFDTIEINLVFFPRFFGEASPKKIQNFGETGNLNPTYLRAGGGFAAPLYILKKALACID